MSQLNWHWNMNSSISTTPPEPGKTLPVAITMGDPAGIGPEIISKVFRDAPDLTRGCFVAGDVASLRRAAGWTTSRGQVQLPVVVIERPSDVWDLPVMCIPVLQVVETTAPVPVGCAACPPPPST